MKIVDNEVTGETVIAFCGTEFEFIADAAQDLAMGLVGNLAPQNLKALEFVNRIQQ